MPASLSCSPLVNSKGMTRTGLRLKVLPFRVILASIAKENLDTCTHGFMKLLLFQERCQFFSFTETTEEISLVLEEGAISFFPDQVLQYTNQVWSIIQVDEGPLGFESVGIVSSISAPLAESQISIYHLSTYMTDHTLVEAENLEKAVATLQAAGFVFTNEEHSPSLSPVSFQPKKSRTEAHGQTQMVLTKLPFELYLARLPTNWQDRLIKPLLKLLFFSEYESRLLSLTVTPTEASLILDQKSIDIFPPNSLEQCSDVWRALQICEGAYGFNEFGIVSKFAAPLADAKISIFNLSTYGTDYALVADKSFADAMTTLTNSFDIITDEL